MPCQREDNFALRYKVWNGRSVSREGANKKLILLRERDNLVNKNTSPLFLLENISL